jgi:hypothetical protein
MKAIKIPNASFLDVFGRPVAINNHDLQRPSIICNPSYTGQVDKNSSNNHHDHNNKSSTASGSISKSDHAEKLTVIG